MVHPPKTPTPRRKAGGQDVETSTEDAAAIVREPPLALDTSLRAIGASSRRAPSGFFRDPDAFRALAGLVPPLFAEKGPDEAVRVWVAGCGSGEEAWSIAILLAEHAATLANPPLVQLFATDTDAPSCARGRNALYPASAVSGIPAGRLSRFFVWEGGGYRVAKPLRQAVLFATHDVLRDPAFDRLDLAVCRGMLAALPADRRARMVDTFHEALRPGGVLFLGAAEFPGDGAGFAPAAEAHGTFVRDHAPPRPAADPGDDVPTHDGTGSRR